MVNANIDEGVDNAFDEESGSKPKKKRFQKLLIILIPLVIVIGSAVAFFSFFQPNMAFEHKPEFQVVNKTNKQSQVFYDFPKMNIQVKNPDGESQTLKIQFSIELTSVDDVPNINGLSAQITDSVIAHTAELTPDEVSGVNGLYWLKEELLERINLITDPIKVSSINFKSFEFQKSN